MSVPPHQQTSSTGWKSKVATFFRPNLKRPFEDTKDEDINLAIEAQRVLLASCSSSSSEPTPEEWYDAFRAAFHLSSKIKLLPNAEEPLRNIALLMGQTAPNVFHNPPDPAYTNQWKAAQALFKSLDDNTSTTNSITTGSAEAVTDGGNTNNPNSTTGSAEDVNGDDVLSSLSEEMKKDLMFSLDTLSNSSYFAKVFVSGRIAAALSNMFLPDFAVANLSHERVLSWYNGTTSKTPRVEELKSHKFDPVRDGYKQLTDMKQAEKQKTASRLQIDVQILQELPTYKCFLEFLRCFRQTVSDLCHMHPNASKEDIMTLYKQHFVGTKTQKAYKEQMSKLQKKYATAHKERINVAREVERRKREEARAEARKKQAEEEEERRKLAEAEAQRKHDEEEAQRKHDEEEAQRKRDEEAQAEAKKKQAEAEEERRKIAEAEAQRKRKEEAQAEAKKKHVEAEDVQREVTEAKLEISNETNCDANALYAFNSSDPEDSSHNNASTHVVNSMCEPVKRSFRKNLKTLPLHNKKRRFDDTSLALVTSSSISTAATSSDDTGASTLADDCTKRHERILGLLTRLLVILEFEDDIISPRNYCRRTLCGTFDLLDQKHDHAARCFIHLVFNILLDLKQDRGDAEVNRVILELGANGLLDVAAMAGASEDRVTHIVEAHSKFIDAKWMVHLAREIVAAHRGVTPMTHSALRALASVQHILSEEAIILFFQDMGCSSGLVIDSDTRRTLVAIGMVDVDEDIDPSTEEVGLNKVANKKVAEGLMTWLPKWKWQSFQEIIRTLVELIKFPALPEMMARMFGTRIKERFVREEQEVLIEMIDRIAVALRPENGTTDWLDWLRADDNEGPHSPHRDDDKQCASVEANNKPHSINNPSIDANTTKSNPTVILPYDCFWLPPLETNAVELIERSFTAGSATYMERALVSLGPKQKLIEHAIDRWCELLNAREVKRFPYDANLRSFCFTCFLWTKLMQEGNGKPGYNFKAVSRWFQRLPGRTFLNYHFVVFPINTGEDHWIAVVANLWAKKLYLLNSLASPDESQVGKKCLDNILRLLMDEHKRMQRLANPEEWTLVKPSGVPQQNNHYDCGVYTCLFADFILRNRSLQFTPEQVTSMRYHIAYAIINDSAPIWP